MKENKLEQDKRKLILEDTFIKYISKMKLKNIGRLGGLLEFIAGAGFEYLYLNRIDFSKIDDFFLGDKPLEYKLLGAIVLTIPHLLAIPLALDGVIDIYKGTHHYFFASLYKRISKDEKTRKEISDYIEKNEKYRDDYITKYN